MSVLWLRWKISPVRAIKMAVYPWEGSIEDGKVSAQLRGDLDISGDLTVSGNSPGSIHDALVTGLHGLLNKYELSDDVLHSHDAVVDTSNGTYTILKSITINTLHNTPETIRISFSMWSGSATAGKEAYGKIYKNGAPVGTERINGTTSLVTYTEDLSFANGDVIELYAYNAEDFLMETYVSNFRVKGVAHANTLQDALTDTHVGVTTPFEGTNS